MTPLLSGYETKTVVMEDEERRKRARRTTLDQLEEERIFPVLETTEGESNEAEASSCSSDEDEDDVFEYSDEEFLHGGGVPPGFTEDEDDDYSYDYYEGLVEEDDVDPDELSYEELIALGEMVGVESRGLSDSDINKHLRPFTCESTINLLIDRCVICQLEYEPGEKLVALHCDHPYHNDCIRQWLHIKKICPICNNEVATTKETTNDGNKL